MGNHSSQATPFFKNTLANSLSELAKGGMTAFYNGSLGQRLVDDIKESAGILSMEDLKSYRVKIRKPVTADLMGLQIVSAPPPASGGTILILVSIFFFLTILSHISA